MARQKVTIVVPVYGDWPSLDQCIASLIQHVSQEHTVLFVNDCGPEVELLEKNIKKKIAKQHNMSYYRNPENMGFVKTCNRAVYELDATQNDVLLLNSDTIVTEGFLDELIDVLYLSEKHGTVCPRSNNATIASLPFLNMDNTDDRDLSHSKATYDKISPRLARYQVVPVVIGFCMLIKRSLINDYGLFDEAYRLGYGEECDFCQRVNKYGYSSILANHAYVYHLESRSFTSEKKARMMALNEKVLHGRYPYYPELVQRYIRDYMDPVDWFADVIANKDKKTKILINLMHLPTLYNGTSRNAITFLTYLQNNKTTRKKYEFTIVASSQSIKFFHLDTFGFKVKQPHEVDELYHLGYCPSQIFSIDQLLLMNRYCYRIVFSLLDIIAIRSNKLLANDYAQRAVFLDSFRTADKIISISDFTKEDAISYFGPEIESDLAKIEVIRQGYNNLDIFGKSESKQLDLKVTSIVTGEPYVLMLGNMYDFKRLKEAVSALSDFKGRLVILGYDKSDLVGDNVTTMPMGSMSDRQLTKIRQNARVAIFPSVYEGFGLPILECLHDGCPVIISDTSLNREIKKLCDNNPGISTFRELDTLKGEVERVLAKQNRPSAVELRKIDSYNEEVLMLINATLNMPPDDQALRDRWRYYGRLITYMGSRSSSIATRRTIIHFMADTLRQFSPSLYRVSRTAFRKLKSKV